MTELRKHAFLTSRGFEYRENGEWTVERFDFITSQPSPDQVYNRLWSANRAVWILSEEWANLLNRWLAPVFTLLPVRFEVKRNEVCDEDEDGEYCERSEERRERLQRCERITFKPKGAQDKDAAQLFFPAKARAWGFDNEDSAEEIERAIDRFQKHFKRSMVYRPGLLNAYLMEASRERAKEQVDYKRKPAALDMFKPVRNLDWSKVRPLAHIERTRPDSFYVHAFDKSAMYLQAVAIPLGVGEYRHCRKPLGMHTTKNGMIPGVWRVDSIDCRDVDLPLILMNVPGEAEWICTPTLKLMHDLGMGVKISEAYLCEDSHKLFPTYQSHVRQALQMAASERDGLMKSLVKAMYTQGIGYLNSTLFGEEWFGRPDWWAMIVSEASARVFRDAVEVYKDCGAVPVATHVDCLYYITMERDAYKALPIFSPHSNRGRFANKFRFKGTAPLTGEMASAYENGIEAGKFAGMHKRAAKQFMEARV